jgi:hypothetical protein
MIKSTYGCHGSQLHEDIFNAIRFHALPAMWKRGYEGRLGCVASEQLIAILTGQDNRKNKESGNKYGVKVPDTMFVNCSRNAMHLLDDGELQELIVMVEIGRFQPHKWPEYPVIHVSFEGQIQVTGKTRRLVGFINDLVSCIKDAVGTLGEISPERQPVYSR